MKNYQWAGYFLVLASAWISGCSERPNLEQQAQQNQVEFVARGLTINGPDTVPGGWTTFHFINESPMIHFAVLERLPDGYGVKEQQAEVAPVFQQGMDLLNAGEGEAAMEAFGRLPKWFAEIQFLGGPGFVSAGLTAHTTVYLSPGKYLLECYVKTGGRFHSFNPDPAMVGMVHEFTVPDQPAAGTVAPSADITVAVSSDSGFQIDGELAAGMQTIAVEFVDQKLYENFLGHDVHLVKLADDTDPSIVAEWMNWTHPRGLETPAPATFVGGIHEMPAGSTGYFSADLEPGAYALVSEIPESQARNMFKVIEVR